MDYSQDIVSVEQKVWLTGNKYRGQFESESIVTIWSDMIYLHKMKPEYAAVFEQMTSNLKKMIERLYNLANSDEVQSAVVNDFNENVRHALLPRTNDKNRLQIFNEIREDGVNLIHEKCDRIVLMKILQQMNIDFGPHANGAIATPDRLNRLMAQIATTKLGEVRPVTVYDPASGTGGSLIALRHMVDESRPVKLVGQELNAQAYIRCKMMLDLISDNTTNYELINSDALNASLEGNNVAADVVITDPPYSMKWDPKPTLLETIPYSEIGVLPPKSKADFAFVLHGLSHLKNNGIMVIQLPHGVLFRSAAEEKIRRYLIEQNYIDAVIGLPAKIQYGTSIPTMLLVLRKSRERKEVLFIDASNDFEKSRPNNVLPESSVNTIVETYKSFHNVSKYAHVATQDEILANDFNLNIPRYVDSYTPPEAIAIVKLEKQLTSLNYEVETLGVRIQKIMSKYRDE